MRFNRNFPEWEEYVKCYKGLTPGDQVKIYLWGDTFSVQKTDKISCWLPIIGYANYKKLDEYGYYQFVLGTDDSGIIGWPISAQLDLIIEDNIFGSFTWGRSLNVSSTRIDKIRKAIR